MALTVSDLQAARDRLVEARATGLTMLVDQNGERIEYKTDAQMAAALAALDAEIARLTGRPAPRAIVFRTSKGL